MYTGQKSRLMVTIQKRRPQAKNHSPTSQSNQKHLLNILGDGPLRGTSSACRHTHACGGDDGGERRRRRRSLPINACAEVALRKWMVERYGSELGMGECTVGIQRRPHNARTSCHTSKMRTSRSFLSKPGGCCVF